MKMAFSQLTNHAFTVYAPGPDDANDALYIALELQAARDGP
jgi:hypothetical protein